MNTFDLLYPEGCPLAWFAVDVDEALVLLDDAINRGQSKPCAPAHPVDGIPGIDA